MHIDDVLTAFDGVATRDQLVPILGRHRFDNAVKHGDLVSVFPRTFAYPWEADQAPIRRRAALLSVGGDVALSHLTVLGLLELPVPEDAPIHVTAYQPRHPRGVPGELVVHRTLLPLAARDLEGVPVLATEPSLVSAWPLLAGPARRAPMIEAAQRGLLSDARLADCAERMWWVPGIRELRDVVGLLLAGCESELEMWGYTGVFDVPELSDANRQRVVHVGEKAYRLDMAYDEEMLAVELDGRQFHASSERWERDIQRDLALATCGWQTIRLPHSRLHGDVDGCRRDVLAVRAARRRQVA